MNCLYRHKRYERILDMNNVIKLNFNKETVETDVVKEVNKTVVQTNPIYRKMLSFHNSKIGEKLSISDLLR